MITPPMVILGNRHGIRWFMRHHRSFGMAAFDDGVTDAQAHFLLLLLLELWRAVVRYGKGKFEAMQFESLQTD